jgi:hypothetical protein
LNVHSVDGGRVRCENACPVLGAVFTQCARETPAWSALAEGNYHKDARRSLNSSNPLKLSRLNSWSLPLEASAYIRENGKIFEN